MPAVLPRSATVPYIYLVAAVITQSQPTEILTSVAEPILALLNSLPRGSLSSGHITML